MLYLSNRGNAPPRFRQQHFHQPGKPQKPTVFLYRSLLGLPDGEDHGEVPTSPGRETTTQTQSHWWPRICRSERFVPHKKNSNVWAGAEGLFQTAPSFFGGELELILEVPIFQKKKKHKTKKKKTSHSRSQDYIYQPPFLKHSHEIRKPETKKKRRESHFSAPAHSNSPWPPGL